MTQTTEAVCLKADALELERGERLLFTGLTFEAPAGTLVRLAGANGTIPPAGDPAVIAAQAMAKRLCGQRVPLTF